MRNFSLRAVTLTLVAALSVPGLHAQDSLQIRVLSGDNAIHRTDQQASTPPVVQVLDAQGAPVADATVIFHAPTSGPSVTFFGAARSVEITTDAEGRAQPTAMTPNAEPGQYTLDVRAVHTGATASASIAQVNALPLDAPKKKPRFGWKIYALIGVAVAGVIAAIVLGGDGDTPIPDAN